MMSRVSLWSRRGNLARLEGRKCCFVKDGEKKSWRVGG